MNESLALALLGLLFLVLYFPVISDGRTFFFRDIVHFAMPMKLFIVQSFARGELPLWWPNVTGGAPFLALMHPGVYYPLNLLFFVGVDFITAFNIYLISHTLILTLSVYALCRYWRLSVDASFCAAVTALLGGYFLSVTGIYNHFASAIWFPIFLLALDKFLRRGGVRYFVLAVAILALQVLAGGPEECLLSVLVCYFYALVLVTGRTNYVHGWHGKTLALAGIVILALGISAMQLAPTYFLMKATDRNIIGFDYDEAARWSASPNILSSFILPEKIHEAMVRFGLKFDFFLQNYYLGFFSMMILFAGVLGILRNRAIQFWVSVFLVGLFFALGKYNPAYEWFYKWVPLVSKFRYPEKFLFITSFAGVFLAGYGFDALLKVSKNSKRWLAVLAIVVLLCTLIMGVYSWKPERHAFETLMILAGLVFICFAWIKGSLSATVFKALVLSLICLDLLLKNVSTIPLIGREYISEPPEVIAKGNMDNSLYRVYSGGWSTEHVMEGESYYAGSNFVMTHLALKERLLANLGTLYGINYFGGFTGVELYDAYLKSTYLNEFDDDQKRSILAKNNVKYLVSLVDEVKSTEENPLGEMEVEELADAMPRAYLVGDAVFEPFPRVVKKFYDPSFDARKEVLLTAPVQWNRAENFEGSVLSLDHTPNRVRLKTRQNGDGFLVLLDSYFPGWTVRVDGEEGQIYRGNYFYRAVKLGSGEHTVEFTYLPVGFKLGWAVSLGTLIVLVFIAGVPPVRRRLFPA